MERSAHTAKQHGHRLHMRKVPKSTETTNTQFGPITIYTFTDLEHLWKAASLHRKKTNRKRNSKTLSSVKLLSSRIVLQSAVLPYLLQAPSILCSTVSFTGPDRMHMLCFLKASGESKIRDNTHTLGKKSTLSGDTHKWFQSWVPLKGLSPLENRGQQH